MKKFSCLLLFVFLSATSCLSRKQQEPTDTALNEAVEKRTWQGIPGLERTAGGRLFFSWFTGGVWEPDPENMVLLCYSDDGGKTHSPLQVMGSYFSDGNRAYDPVPWIDPKGRLWYIFCRSNMTTGEHGVYARICDNPDMPEPVFSPEFRIGFDVPYSFRLNKPTVLSSGEWLMPVTFVNDSVYSWFAGISASRAGGDWQEAGKKRLLQGVGISYDEGKTWKLHGAVEAPPWALECMVTELKDGRLRMLIRTGSGYLWESFSTDKGVTWSEGQRSEIASPGSRYFIRRLSSGNLLLVNHYNYDGRSHLTAQISVDDGMTWNEGLLLDPRKSVSYPDGVEDKNGVIWIIYDYDREGEGEILLAKFREEDVVQGKNVSGEVLLQHVINKIPDKNYPLDRDKEKKFYQMTEEESKEYEADVWRQIADLALIPPKINTTPSSVYDADQQDYVMALTNEITPKGRHWAAWIGNCDCPNAILLAAKSDDDGKTWSKPCLVIDAHLSKFPVPRTVILGNFWTDPSGRLWLFFDQTMNHHDGRGGLWVTICENPDADNPVWSAPKRIWHGGMLNKPTILSSGEWLLCTYLLQTEHTMLYPSLITWWYHNDHAFSQLEPYRGVNLLASKDQGKTWELRSVQKFPEPDWHEPMVVEKQNGQLWMLTRTRKGLMETFSEDKGYTWSEPALTENFKHPASRFFFRKLASGRILLIKNGDKLNEHNGRNQFSAWLSDDDGQTWAGGLIIDDRPRVTYPDGTQGPDGTIYITYDHNRGDGEFMMAKFTEEDILAGKIVSPNAQLKMVVFKPGKK